MKSIQSSPTMSWQEIFDLIRPDLEMVERQVRTDMVSSVPAVTAIGQYLQVSGGKRLRPALVMLSARLFGETRKSAIRLAGVVEMIHTATLVHDDVIDGADRRRGRPSTNLRWGNHASVLAGDWLYMQAFKTALEERNFRILDILIELTQMMVEGELLQMEMIGRLDVTVEEHLDLVHRKTACLFGASTRLGAVLGGQGRPNEDRLCEYGKNLGMAFQLADDLLDFTASEEILGKPVGGDLREGKVTLPLIYLMERCRPEEQARIASMVQERAFQSVSWKELLEILEGHNIPHLVKQQARSYARAALLCLEDFPDSAYKRALAALSDFVVDRES